MMIFKELINHNEAKVIYVFTKSSKSKRKQEIVIEKTQESINKIINNSNFEGDELKKIVKKMKISEGNTVFVNFIGDEDIPKHGINKLFSKIKSYFKSTESYKNSIKKKSMKYIEIEAQILKERAKDEMLLYKIGGGLIGAIPGVDLVVQQFIIKKNALNKISQIFGLDIDETEKYEKMNKKEIINNKKNFEKSDSLNELGNSGKSLLTHVGYAGGLSVIESGLGHLEEIVTTTILKETKYLKFFSWEFFKTITTTVLDTSSTVERVGINAVKIGVEIVLSAAMSVVGIGLGAYFTSKDLNELIEKFYKLYLEYGPILLSSYFRAVEYLNNMELNNN